MHYILCMYCNAINIVHIGKHRQLGSTTPAALGKNAVLVGPSCIIWILGGGGGGGLWVKTKLQ